MLRKLIIIVFLYKLFGMVDGRDNLNILAKHEMPGIARYNQIATGCLGTLILQYILEIGCVNSKGLL